jgi:hypothetical protein
MLLLLGGAQWLLPGWLRMFLEAIRQYHQYTQNQSVLVWTFGAIVGRILEAVSAILCAICVWPMRRQPASDPAFGRSFALVMALTVLIVPMFAPYNQVLLMPAILALLQSEFTRDLVLPAVRLARAVGGVLVAWPWVAAFGLSVASVWLTPTAREHVWPMPFYSNFMVPVFIFGLALLNTWGSQTRTLRDSAPAE